mgnify:CR=1 FL=1
MKMNLKSKLASAAAGILVAGFAVTLPASAAEWAPWQGQNETAPLAIYTDSADETGALLVCDGQGMMRAMLSLKPASIPELMAQSAKYSRSTRASIQVGDGEAAEGMFRYIPAIKSVEINSHSSAAKIFNSAVLGETLTVVTQREGTVESNLPKPNDTFKAFAKTCGSLRDQTPG